MIFSLGLYITVIWECPEHWEYCLVHASCNVICWPHIWNIKHVCKIQEHAALKLSSRPLKKASLGKWHFLILYPPSYIITFLSNPKPPLTQKKFSTSGCWCKPSYVIVGKKVRSHICKYCLYSFLHTDTCVNKLYWKRGENTA